MDYEKKVKLSQRNKTETPQLAQKLFLSGILPTLAGTSLDWAEFQAWRKPSFFLGDIISKKFCLARS